MKRIDNMADGMKVFPDLDGPGKEKRLNSRSYMLSTTAVLESLTVDSQTGLAAEEVIRRRARTGWNRLAEVRELQPWRIFLAQFKSLVVGLLGVAATVAWVTGGRIEALAILVVLLVNALIGFLMEWQAGRALEALRRQTRSLARVRRDGVEEVVEAEELVPGDIVILNPGDRVPADLRLIEAANLRTEESALTGESTPVNKSTDPVGEGTLLAERYSMVYLGTSVAAGRAIGVVTETGSATELGKIGTLVAETADEVTPLRQQLDDLGRQLVYLVLGIGVVIFFAGWWRGDGLLVMLETAISLAVAAVPEGLPTVTTLILALGVLRMARANAIVRHLPAVETLGSATVICTDKTGTLTENRMVVREFRLGDGRTISVGTTGARREPEVDQLWRRTLEAAALCNEASLSGRGETIGDPTETALLESARDFGVDIDQLRLGFPKVAEEPFDTATRRMITVHRQAEGGERACLKGAPSVVLGMCSGVAIGGAVGDGVAIVELSEERRQELREQNEEMAGKALRVLAIAEKRADGSISDRDQGYHFLGLIGMLDPPRREAAPAIERAYEAGIRVIMLTGDQLNTARAIARELRIEERGELVARHARELAAVSGPELARLAGSVQVFARVSPEDKLRIVEALKEAGEVVAVTGDGVNDAPALKRADIGVAMGQRGTETAREAADVVLTDDNFATIIKAVEGGRTIYANIAKFVQLMLSENLAEVIFIFLAIVLGLPLPLLPLQILWINLVTDIFPALALALEPPSAEIMKSPPRRAANSMLSGSFFVLVGWQGLMLALICLGYYMLALEKYGPGEHARTIALFTVIGVQVGHLFNCRSRVRSAFEGLFVNRYIWLAILVVGILQLLAVYLEPLPTLLQTRLIDQTDLAAIIGSIILPVLIVEAVKLVSRLRQRR